MKIKEWLWVLLIWISYPATSQEQPVYHHYYANPFLINPAMAGEDYRPSLFVSHRRQWVGIEEAPVSSSLAFHAPLGDKLGFGLQAHNDSRGLLNSTSGLITFAYKAMFAPDHFLKFGLSGGALSRSIKDLDGLMSDPRYFDDDALTSLLDNNLFIDGKFGLIYHIKGFHIGLTLPRLFSSKLLSSEAFTQGEFNPLNSYHAMFFYKSPAGKSISFEPYFIYKAQEGQESIIEGAGMLRIKDAVWLGGIYRHNLSTSAVLCIAINDALQFGYSYDIASDPASTVSKGTHGIMLKLNFGQEKRPEKRARTVSKTEETTTSEPRGEVEDRPESPAGGGRIANYTGPETVKAGNHKLDLKEGYYVVVGVFGSYERAKEYSETLFQTGYYTKYGYSSDAGYYYVYIYYSENDSREADNIRNNFVQRPQFGDAWVLTVR